MRTLVDLQPGDIILFKGKGIVSSLVKFFTKSKYSHAAMVLTDNMIIEANWYKNVNIVEFKYDSNTMEIYRLKGGLNANQQLILLQSSYDMLNKYYDYAQLLGYVLERFIGKQYNNPLNFDNFIICSELIDKSYHKLGIDLVEYRSYGNVTPDDLAKSKHLERIL